MKYDLAIIIPARQEFFLAKTVADILEKSRSNVQVIAVLDGAPDNPPIKEDPRVTVLYFEKPIGQRACTNKGVEIADAKYIMKCDAHCGFDEGFDIKLIDDMQDNWTMVPVMKNLHAFDWVCEKCKYSEYQGPTPIKCPKCDNKTDFIRDMKWVGKPKPVNDSYSFNTEPQFRYFKQYRNRDEYKEGLKIGLTETMSLQGSCFLMTREKYLELGVCDEAFGSWGSQGVEVAVKTWLSGGKCMVSHKTWYGHMFRPQGGDFGFQYPRSARKYIAARAYAHDLFFNNQWDKQIYPLSWLIKRFWPVPEWTEDDIIKVSSHV